MNYSGFGQQQQWGPMGKPMTPMTPPTMPMATPNPGMFRNASATMGTANPSYSGKFQAGMFSMPQQQQNPITPQMRPGVPAKMISPWY